MQPRLPEPCLHSPSCLALSLPSPLPNNTTTRQPGLDGTVTFAPAASPQIPDFSAAALNGASPFAAGPAPVSVPGLPDLGSNPAGDAFLHMAAQHLGGGMQPMGAGTTTVGPSLAGAASPFDVTGVTGPPSGMPMVVDAGPRVETPPEDDIELPIDLINGLQGLGSTDLMLTDDLNKDEIWDTLFGAGTSASLAHGSSLGAQGLGQPAAAGSPGGGTL